MGLFRKRGFEEEPGGGQDLPLDLDTRVCATCRRELLPWEQRCPDDGGAAVRREDLPAPQDPLMRRFLEEGADDVAPADEAERDPGGS